MSDPFKGVELRFPVQCHYKVVAENTRGIELEIEKVVRALGIEAPLTRGNASSGGKYIAYNLSIEVHSREFMYKVDSELRSIHGVKTVL